MTPWLLILPYGKGKGFRSVSHWWKNVSLHGYRFVEPLVWFASPISNIVRNSYIPGFSMMYGLSLLHFVYLLKVILYLLRISFRWLLGWEIGRDTLVLGFQLEA